MNHMVDTESPKALTKLKVLEFDNEQRTFVDVENHEIRDLPRFGYVPDVLLKFSGQVDLSGLNLRYVYVNAVLFARIENLDVNDDMPRAREYRFNYCSNVKLNRDNLPALVVKLARTTFAVADFNSVDRFQVCFPFVQEVYLPMEDFVYSNPKLRNRANFMSFNASSLINVYFITVNGMPDDAAKVTMNVFCKALIRYPKLERLQCQVLTDVDMFRDRTEGAVGDAIHTAKLPALSEIRSIVSKFDAANIPMMKFRPAPPEVNAQVMEALQQSPDGSNIMQMLQIQSMSGMSEML